jgi:hypothetical protein
MWLIFAVVVLTSLLRNDVFQGTTQVVDWDGYGYYAYLPAAFIYDDIERYAFAEAHLATYEMSNDLYQLMETENGSRFPIYNLGLAVVWTPAFLLTHAIVVATGIAPADGMSYPYQLMLVLMSLLFAFLGLLYLRKLLLLYFLDTVAALTLLAVALGSNIFYYIVEGPDVTHGYLFALYAIFLYHFARISSGYGTSDTRQPTAEGSSAANQKSSSEKPKRLSAANRESRIFNTSNVPSLPGRGAGGGGFSANRRIIYCGLLAGLMCLTRSSEIVLFAIPAFYGLRNWSSLQRNFWRTLPIFAIALAVFSLQLIYYKIGTGAWWRDGYAGLGFDWRSPHIYDGFFSYRRGWLVYTPVMAFALIGLGWLRKGWLLPVLIFVVGNCYILFSWHIWWYGDTFGSRPVTQSYALLALPLAAFLTWAWGGAVVTERSRNAGAGKGGNSAKIRRALTLTLLAAFVSLNLFQHWQYNQRILPLDFVNKTYYWHVFGATELNKKARVYLDTNEKLPPGNYQTTPIGSVDTLVIVPPKASREFTKLLHHRAETADTNKVTWLRTSLSFAYFGDRYDKWKFPAIITEHKRGDEMLKWIQIKIPPTMDSPASDSLRFDLSLPGYRSGDLVRQYVWNLCQDSMVISQYQARLLTR